MRPTRRTQPYRKGKPRPPGQALNAMKRGRDFQGGNPADVKRKTAKRAGIAARYRASGSRRSLRR